VLVFSIYIAVMQTSNNVLILMCLQWLLFKYMNYITSIQGTYTLSAITDAFCLKRI